MRPTTIQEIADKIGGKILCGDPATVVTGVAIDSREEQSGCIFIPIIGEKSDAHRFIGGAFSHGAVATLTSRTDIDIDETKPYILVEDTVEGLRGIGKLCRERSMIPAIGVTGSVGKTTTREMIAAALSSSKKVFKTSKNYNSRIGSPITMTLLDDAAETSDIAVLECGMAVPGELGDIAELDQLSMAVVTNVGVAHIEFYGTQEKICEEKLSITRGLNEGGQLILNGDDPLLYAHRNDTGFPVLLYGLGEQNDYRAVDVETVDGFSSFTMQVRDVKIPVKLSVPGEHNVRNALAALACADQCGLDLGKAAEALQHFTGFQNRLQVFHKGKITIIDDTYNASPDSFHSGLQVLGTYGKTGTKYAVLGDMFELGTRAEEMHRLVGKYAAESDADVLVVIGENSHLYMADEALKLRPELTLRREESTAAAAAWLRENLRDGDIVYLKASNGMHFKEITAAILAD